MLAFKGPAQPSPTLGDAFNAGYGYLEVRCLGCDTHQTVALDIVRRPKATPIHELERYMRYKDCSQVRGYPYKRSHLIALRATKITASDPPSTWWPGIRRREWDAQKNFTTLSYSFPRHAAVWRAFRTRCQSANHCEHTRCSNPKPRLCLR